MKLRNLLISLGVIASAASPAHAATDPDFAHPRKVLSYAYAELERTAGDKDAGPQRVRAVLEICTAAQSIDPDSIFSLVHDVTELADKETNPTAQSLLRLVDAKLLNNAYNRRRWVYDRLDTPDTPLPQDITEWNGRQFRSQIAENAEAALKGAREHNVPLAGYSAAVRANDRTLLYFPQTADFVACDVYDLLQGIGRTEQADSLIGEMLAAQKEGSAPYYYWLSRNIEATSTWQDRFQAYLDAYKAHSHDEYARLLLEDACDARNDKAQRLPLIALVEESLERFPGYWNNNALRNALASLKQARNTVEYPQLVCPGRPFDVKVTADFARKAGFRIYSVPEGREEYSRITFSALKAVVSQNVAGTDSTITEHICPVTLPKPGVYMVAPTVNGRTENEQYGLWNAIVCSPYVPVAMEGCDEQVVVMADFATGHPAEGVKVLAKSGKRQAMSVGTTDKNGLARFQLTGRNSYEISAVTPQGEPLDFAHRINIRMPWRGEEPVEADDDINISVIPARPIYHFGDTLRWAVIADSHAPDKRSRHAAAGLKIEVELTDANGQHVDSVFVVTDRYGRAFGTFALPTDGLSGNFTIEASVDDESDAYGDGSADVPVSDYRMPVFEITDLSAVRDTPARGGVSISGRAVTYSGMPVADARVDIVVHEAWRWRWWMPAQEIGSLEVKTDATGRFTAVLTDELLKKGDGHDFRADISVTATSGENATAQKPFTNGRPYLISISGKKFLRAETRTMLPVTVYDADGENADIELRWKLAETDGGNVVASGKCRSQKPTADLDRVRGGNYTLTVEAADSTMADTSHEDFLVYNVELCSLPDGYPLLVDETRVRTDATGRAAFRYGVAKDNTWLYAVLCTGRKIVEIEVHKRDKGFRHLSLDLPADANRGALHIFTVRDGMLRSFTVGIERPAQRDLTISGESFRDRLTPGATEQWNLHITAADGKPVEAAMTATMYSHSLDALARLSWPATFHVAREYPNLSLDYLPDSKRSSDIASELRTIRELPLNAPAFRYLSGPLGNVYIRGSRKMAANGVMRQRLAVAEDSEEDGVVMESADMAAPMMAGAVAGVESKSEALCESVVVTTNNTRPEENFDYRDADVAEAFWMPDLASAPDGSLEMSFRLPDANTTWRMQALAWTEDMKAGTLIRDFVANKPVMVQPNLPRFLRAGDKARILATVYNNDSAVRELRSVVEVFDPATMKVIATAESCDTVAPDASAIVAIEVEAPADAASLGYRVRSSSDSFADGEQTVIPVESAQCDVIESQTFYLNPGDKELKIKVPSDKNGTYTLQYCQNPSWSIVKALPGLVDYEPSTTPGAVHSLFAACTAKGIVDRVPAISDALKAWKDKPLQSRLAANDALKTAELRATPWVQAAAGDSMRMARLGLLLDNDETARNIHAAIKTLSDLATADGGLRWGKWCDEASLWATQLALHDLGLLRLAGYLPDDAQLHSMMVKALAYTDKELERLDRNRRMQPDMSYAVTRSLWKDIRPSAWGQRVIDATLRDCAARWREASTSGKANMAILLDIYGRKTDAREIMSSVKEFAVATPAQGVSFPSVGDIDQYAPMLMAFGRIEPTSSLIDGMRQWLVVREQATVGLGSYDASQLVGAFLTSGTPWHTDNAPATVQLGRHTVDLGDACAYGGEATVSLGSDAAGKTLRIAPGADVPSFGAVISSYRSRPADVKAASCDAVSIEKRLVRVKAGGDNTFAADTVALGDRVRVLLTLHVNRDMQYVTIIDERAAGLEPVDQTPGMTSSAGAYFYRESRDASTRMFISRLPKGTYQLSYDCTANTAGTFAAGLATVQSALAPALTAHSAGAELIVR